MGEIRAPRLPSVVRRGVATGLIAVGRCAAAAGASPAAGAGTSTGRWSPVARGGGLRRGRLAAPSARREHGSVRDRARASLS